MSTPAYCAPASKVVTVLHLRDLDAKPGEQPEPYDGMTRCGLPLVVADLWIPVDRQPEDSVCRECQGLSDEQGAMW